MKGFRAFPNWWERGEGIGPEGISLQGLFSVVSDLNRVALAPARVRRFPEGARDAWIHVTSGVLGKREL